MVIPLLANQDLTPKLHAPWLFRRTKLGVLPNSSKSDVSNLNISQAVQGCTTLFHLLQIQHYNMCEFDRSFRLVHTLLCLIVGQGEISRGGCIFF